MEEPLKITRPNPYDTASFWQKLWFVWVLPIFNLGWDKDLEREDLYICPKEDDPKVMADALEK